MASEQKSLASILQARGISGRLLFFVTILFFGAITLAPPMQRYFSQRAQINALKSEVHDASLQLKAAQAELAQWNDPQYVASQARARLHFIFPGERQYVVLGLAPRANNSSAPAAPISDQIPVGLPWYSRLISSITSTNVNP